MIENLKREQISFLSISYSNLNLLFLFTDDNCIIYYEDFLLFSIFSLNNINNNVNNNIKLLYKKKIYKMIYLNLNFLTF